MCNEPPKSEQNNENFAKNQQISWLGNFVLAYLDNCASLANEIHKFYTETDGRWRRIAQPAQFW